jgi:hypothetical protein
MAAPDAARRVQRWLESEDYTIQRLPDAAGLFELRITDPPGRNYNIVWQEKIPGQIMLATATILSDEEQQKFAATPESRQTEFFWDLFRTLLTMGIDHVEGIRRPLQRILISAPIYEDGMNRDIFMSRFALLQRALYVMNGMVTRELALRSPWE